MSVERPRRLTIVQYAGDFREAAERLRGGGAETYRGQRYTVDYVEQLAATLESVTTITGFTDTRYDVVLPSGARAIGAGFTTAFDGRAIARLVAETRPDALILRTPSRPVLRWAIRQRCRTMVLIADSFNAGGWKSRLSGFLLARYLRAGVFDVVANHGVRAAQDLVRVGVPAAKVLPWDYPPFDTPHDRPAKVAAGSPMRLLYAGLLIVEKGVDDLIHAIALLRGQGMEVALDILGKGDSDRLAALAERLGIADAVRLVGPVPNAEMLARMAVADAVVVPSRHEYPEGMPLTIYEALCARSPLIVSDHPMFLGNLVADRDALIFRAGDAAALAREIARLHDASLYGALSRHGAEAWERLQIPVKWHALIDAWLENTAESREWIAAHSLARV